MLVAGDNWGCSFLVWLIAHGPSRRRQRLFRRPGQV
jgi:hypothetical protein